MNPSGGYTRGVSAYPFQQQQQQQQSPTRQSPHNSGSSNNSGPRAKCDQVVFEAIAKAAEIVVASRCWIASSPADTNGGTTGSGRFNLLVPEVKSVRSILQRWKRTMHVPLRLDVYYQHPPTAENETGERELLERWCLEYAPINTNSASDNIMHNSMHVNPIVQLRKVCKNIVVWLRTLYCHSRLLPAQALRRKDGQTPSNIGFSIYVVGEGQDDVSGLLRQGFNSEPKANANGGVPTPYGVLGWKVYLAPRELVQKLVAMERETMQQLQSQNYRIQATTNTATKSIPMKVVPQHHGFQYSTTPPTTASPSRMIARSAPGRGYRRANSSPIESTSNPVLTANAPAFPQPQHRYSASTTNPGISLDATSPTLVAPRSFHPRSNLPRRHTEDFTEPSGLSAIHSRSNGSNPTSSDNTGTNTPSSIGSGGISGGKNLSALSLALMTMKDTETNGHHANNNNEMNHQYPVHDEQHQTPEEIAASEKRRKALHNAPPTAISNTGVGEYGYAYNSSNSPKPVVSSSPTSLSHFRGPSTPCSSTLGTTPPGYLLSATPSMGSHIGSAGLIPPARLSGAGSSSSPKTTGSAVAPPFVRPLGFSGQAAIDASEVRPAPLTMPSETTSMTTTANGALATPTSEDPKPALDLLHSSPFQGGLSSHQPSKDGLSSFLQAEETSNIAAATTFINEFYHHHYLMHSHGGDDNDIFPTENDIFGGDEGLVLQAEDMPFAVDGFSTSATNTPGENSSMTPLLSATKHDTSSLVASMCVAPPKRLAMFESRHGSHMNSVQNPSSEELSNVDVSDTMVESLADQLADFKSFGASLVAATSPVGGPAPMTASVGSGG